MLSSIPRCCRRQLTSQLWSHSLMKISLSLWLILWMGFFNMGRAEDANTQTIYFSVGDSQDLLWTPLESKASIDAVFDVLHDKYKFHRVWWRGGQDEIWGNQFVLREQNRYYWRVWEWWRDLQYRVVKCNQLAVEAAHKRGMQIWMAYGLFDNGSPPDAGLTGFPYAAEDKIRVEHPEWAPENRYGTWRQGGPIEFCYEGARRAMVDYLTKYVVAGSTTEPRCCLRSSASRCRFAPAASASSFCRTSRVLMALAAKSVHAIVSMTPSHRA